MSQQGLGIPEQWDKAEGRGPWECGRGNCQVSLAMSEGMGYEGRVGIH